MNILEFMNEAASEMNMMDSNTDILESIVKRMKSLRAVVDDDLPVKNSKRANVVMSDMALTILDMLTILNKYNITQGELEAHLALETGRWHGKHNTIKEELNEH